ncbi:hypothetical protein, partial [Brevundimonas sp. Leaf168]|uniref:hypothetical protein n=1 Tax=Brevundimonas sp. Leaf168 TaxID=1736283 RepID=UPI000A41AF97
MKKFAALMAGVAAIATAGAASADPIYQGSATGSVTIPFVGTLSGTSTNPFLVGAIDLIVNPGVNSNISLFTVSGGSAGNNGQAIGNDGATFTLKGAVSTDCAYYTGNASTTIDFGTIGI